MDITYTSPPSQSTISQAQTLVPQHTSNNTLSTTKAATVIQSCFRSFQAKKVLQKNRQTGLASVLYNNLKSNNQAVKDGYGEYVVYSKNGTALDKETYNAAYDIIQKYKHDPELSELPSRSDAIESKIQECFPDLALIFIPRTIYELWYLRLGIEEQLESQEHCFLQFQRYDKYLLLSEKKDCWHNCFFLDDHLPNAQDDKVKHLSEKMNSEVLHKYKLRTHLTGKQLLDLLEEEIKWFGNLRCPFNPRKFGYDYTVTGPLYYFTSNIQLDNGCLKITKPDVLRKALAFEVSSYGQNAHLLYRSATYQKDRKLSISALKSSLCYGSSLFSNSMRDKTASPYYYTNQGKDTYCISVSFKNKEESPFYIPEDNAIAQVNARGEMVHARSLYCYDENTEFKQIPGIMDTHLMTKKIEA